MIYWRDWKLIRRFDDKFPHSVITDKAHTVFTRAHGWPNKAVGVAKSPFVNLSFVFFLDLTTDKWGKHNAIRVLTRIHHYCAHVSYERPDKINCLNSLWPSDAIWRCRSESTLAQIIQKCGQIFQITFIFVKYHHSQATTAPVKYERDI